MKRRAFTILAAAALALPLCAQVGPAVAPPIQADIPFEFSVLNTTVAAGKYVITFQAGSLVQLSVGSERYYLLAGAGDSYRGSQAPKLVFHRYGNQYFLSQISAASTSRDFPMSRVERELNNKTVAGARQMQTEIVVAMR